MNGWTSIEQIGCMAAEVMAERHHDVGLLFPLLAKKGDRTT